MLIALRNVAVILGALIPISVIDYFYVRSGQDHNSIWWSPWINYPALLIAPVGFFWANWPTVRGANWTAGMAATWRVAIALLLSVAVAFVWFYLVAFPVVANLHIAWGGWL